MRVTQNMMAENAIRWIQHQAELLGDCEEAVSTGKEVNRPSDNPHSAGQILAERTTISKCAQYMSNITNADTWISASNTTLDAVNSLLSNARASIADETAWSSSRKDITSAYLQQIYDQVVSLANTKLTSYYMYGGNKSTTQPFTDTVDITDGTASDVIFALAGDAASATIAITDSSGNVVRTLSPPGGSEGTNTIAWDGLDDGSNPLPDGVYNFTVSAADASGDAVAEYAAYRGNSSGKTVTIGENSTCTLNNDGGAIFSQALGSLSQVIAALKDGNYSSGLVSSLDSSLNAAIEQIQSEEVNLMNVKSEISSAKELLTNLKAVAANDLANLETGSSTPEEAAVKLTVQKTNYEATIQAIASTLKMAKLSDFL